MRQHCNFTGGNPAYCPICADVLVWERENRHSDITGILCLLLLLLPIVAMVASIGNVSEPAGVLSVLVFVAMLSGLLVREWMQ